MCKECKCKKQEIVKIGTKVKNFKMKAVDAKNKFIDVDFKTSQKNNRWLVVYFYPLDFTFVCPTEIQAMSSAIKRFDELNCDVISVSTDSVFSHLAWKENGLGNISHPMASDTNHEVSKYFNILDTDGKAMRGLFLISPSGIVEHFTVNNGEVGRNVEEELRTLEAYKTGGMAPCGWKPGEDLL